MERLLAVGSAGSSTQDEDLFELWDEMVAFLGQRDRI